MHTYRLWKNGNLVGRVYAFDLKWLLGMWHWDRNNPAPAGGATNLDGDLYAWLRDKPEKPVLEYK